MTIKPADKTPLEPPPGEPVHNRGMTGNQRLILAAFALIAFLALLACTVFLANAEQAVAAGFTGSAATGCLIAFFRLLGDLSK